jgi:hypothetical protein
VNRPQPVVELGVTGVPVRVLEQAVRVIAGVEIEPDVARVALLDRAEREIAVRARVVVAGVRVAAVEELVRQRADQRAVAVLRRRQRLREQRPQLLGVHRDHRRGQHVVAVDGPRVGRVAVRRQRRLVRLVDQLVVRAPRVAATEAQARGLVGRARLEEAPERTLESGRLLEQVLRRLVDVAVRVQRPVQDQRPVAVREQARVGRAQERAVGEPEVVEPALTQARAHQIHVARDVRGRRVGEDVHVVAHEAPPDVAAILGDQRPDVEVERRRERLRVEPRRLLVDLAVDRVLGLAGSARVHADEVEVLAERREAVGAGRLDEVGDRGAGPAEVEEEGSLALTGRVGTRDEHLDPLAVRLVVVQRRLQHRALDVGRIAAGLPVQRWRATGRRRGRGGRQRGRECRGRGQNPPITYPHGGPPLV